MSLLKVVNLNKSYKAIHILKNVNLEIEEGERHILIGPNGAGKTTCFNCIAGTIPFESGDVFIEGKRVSNMPARSRIELGMSRTFQKNNLFNDLTIEENVHLAIMPTKAYRWNFFKPIHHYDDLMQEAMATLEEWGLWEKRNFKVNELSYGEQRLMEMILALSSKPKILLLDEPTSGMSPAETQKTSQLIQSIPRNITLIVIEHDMEVVFSIADRITVLHHGEVILSGKPEEVRGDEKIREIYFGGGAVAHAAT